MREGHQDEQEFPYVDYKCALEKILEQASKDYWAQYIDVNRHQVAVARTYLWVSAAFLGAHFTAGGLLLKHNINNSLFVAIIFILTVVFAASALGVCLYGLPARGGYKRIGASWGTFSHSSYEALESKSQSLYRDALVQLIDEFDAAAAHNLSTNSKRASLLRVTSWLLIVSFLLSLITAITFVVSNIKIISERESTMSEEQAPKPQPAPQTPIGQKPHGPISGLPSGVITHGQNPGRDRVVSTEAQVIITDDVKS